jgi:hypothetical protein
MRTTRTRKRNRLCDVQRIIHMIKVIRLGFYV